MEYCLSQRRASTNSTHTQSSASNVTQMELPCPYHPTDRVTSVCQNPTCVKLLCRRCEDSHDPSHQRMDVLPLPEFTRKASRDLELTINSLKDGKQQMRREVLQQKQLIQDCVEKFFTQIQCELERELEKSVCQLETRYLDIRNNGTQGVVEHLAKKCDVRLPTLEVDSSTICLETVLNRMMHIKRASMLATMPLPEVKVEKVEEVRYQAKPASAGAFFAFPSSIPTGNSYLPLPPRPYQRKNVSLERDMGVSRQSRLSPSVKESVLRSSKIFRDRSQQELPRASIQPFNPFANQKPVLMESNFQRCSSAKKFTSNEIEELLKRTSPKKQQDYTRQAEISTKSFFTEAPKEKENNTFMNLPSTEKFFSGGKTTITDFDYKTLPSKYQDFRPVPFPQIASRINKTAMQYRPMPFAQMPFDLIKPTTTAANNSYKEFFQCQYSKRDENVYPDDRNYRV